MTKKPVKRYTIDGKPMTPDDLRRLHEYLIDMEVISYQVPESVTLQRFPNQVESDSTWRTMGGSSWGLRYRCEKISMRVGYAV